MKIKYINESITRKVATHRYTYEKVDNEYLKGYISLVDIGDKINESMYVPRENREDDCVVSANYKYLRLFYENKKYAIVAAYNDKLEFIEFYIDVINEMKIDNITKLPYIEDLYLDFVYTYKDEILILDEDELENAYLKKEINQYKYNLAIQTKNEILSLLKDKKYMKRLKDYCSTELNRLLLKL